MTMPKPINTANDNMPSPSSVQGTLSGTRRLSGTFKAFDRPSPRPSQTNRFALNPTISSKSEQETPIRVSNSLLLTLGLWAAALLSALIVFMFGASTPFKMLSSLALLWTGLWGSYVAVDHGRWRQSEICIVTALGGMLGAVTTTANYFGLEFTLSEGLILMSLVPLVIGALLKSRISVLTAIAASLGWAVLTFMTSANLSGTALLIPIILAAQIYVATRLQSGLAISFGVITAYYCLVSIALGFYTADELPLTFAAAALFTIGTAHHRTGKALEDKRIAGSAIHIYVGWVAAMTGAIGFQYLWLTPDMLTGGTASLSLTGLWLWKAVIIASLAIIFGSAVIRYKHSQMSFAGVCLLTLSSALIPMMLWHPGSTQDFLASLPGGGFSLVTIGVLIGAAITAISVGMLLNGVRRHSPLMIGLGLTALVSQGLLLLNPALFTVDNIIIFLSSLLAALSVGGIIAGSSMTHQASPPKLKHG